MDEIIKEIPNSNWVEQLRHGNKVWLVKEKEIAFVEFAHDPSNYNIICLRRGCDLQSWHVLLDGSGFDGKQLLLPIKGHLDDNPTPLAIAKIEELKIEIEKLKRKINYLYLFDNRGY